MKVGYLPGVFDLLHNGHLNIIQVAISMCDIIVIGVHTDEFVSAYKRKPIQTQEERANAIRNYFGTKIHAIEIVGQYHIETIIKYTITHIFHGTDWELESYKRQIRYYEDNLCVSIEMVPYTQGVSTSLILSDLDKYKDVDCILFDLDNTLLLNGLPTNQAVECVQFIQDNNIDIQVVTNNNNYTPQQIADSLTNVGINIQEHQVFSSLKQVQCYLSNNPQYVRVYVWGSDNAKSYLHSCNFGIVSDMNIADIIVVLYKSGFVYEDLCGLLTCIMKGIPYIIGNVDLTYPDKIIVKPDTGAIYNMITSLINIYPILVCGKPNDGICDIQLDKKYIMVGDSLVTDAKLAENMNIHFFHKTDASDLGVLLSKLRLAK